jgi:hypothetical protein
MPNNSILVANFYTYQKSKVLHEAEPVVLKGANYRNRTDDPFIMQGR